MMSLGATKKPAIINTLSNKQTAIPATAGIQHQSSKITNKPINNKPIKLSTISGRLALGRESQPDPAMASGGVLRSSPGALPPGPSWRSGRAWCKLAAQAFCDGARTSAGLSLYHPLRAYYFLQTIIIQTRLFCSWDFCRGIRISIAACFGHFAVLDSCFCRNGGGGGGMAHL